MRKKTPRFVALLVLLALTAATAPAMAQAPDDPGIAPSPAPAALPLADPPRSDGERRIDLHTDPRLAGDEPALKSPWAALGLSLGCTLGSLGASVAMIMAGAGDGERHGLLATGFIVGGLGLGIGPSAGHFYAGDTRRGLTMGATRLGIMTVGIVLELSALGLAIDVHGDPVSGEMVCLVAGIAAGAAALVLGIVDIVAAPGAARLANANARQRRARLRVTPLVTDAGAGGHGYGLALGGRF